MAVKPLTSGRFAAQHCTYDDLTRFSHRFVFEPPVCPGLLLLGGRRLVGGSRPHLFSEEERALCKLLLAVMGKQFPEV